MTASSPKSEATRKSIRQAFLRIEKGRPKVVDKGRKISIASVAEEAGLSRAAIHKSYPDIAEKIREVSGKAVRSQRDQKKQELKCEKEKNRALRLQLAELGEKVKVLASKNATLTLKNNELQILVDSKNITVLMPNKG
jgi:AcrR family transcriptional regulator